MREKNQEWKMKIFGGVKCSLHYIHLLWNLIRIGPFTVKTMIFESPQKHHLPYSIYKANIVRIYSLLKQKEVPRTLTYIWEQSFVVFISLHNYIQQGQFIIQRTNYTSLLRSIKVHSRNSIKVDVLRQTIKKSSTITFKI